MVQLVVVVVVEIAVVAAILAEVVILVALAQVVIAQALDLTLVQVLAETLEQIQLEQAQNAHMAIVQVILKEVALQDLVLHERVPPVLMAKALEHPAVVRNFQSMNLVANQPQLP